LDTCARHDIRLTAQLIFHLYCAPPNGTPAKNDERGRMRKGLSVVVCAVAVALGSSADLRAHHSHAMFDMSRDVAITGTVTAYAYRNPHVFLYIDVKGADGEVKNWAVEMSNIANIDRKRTSL